MRRSRGEAAGEQQNKQPRGRKRRLEDIFRHVALRKGRVFCLCFTGQERFGKVVVSVTTGHVIQIFVLQRFREEWKMAAGFSEAGPA